MDANARPKQRLAVEAETRDVAGKDEGLRRDVAGKRPTVRKGDEGRKVGEGAISFIKGADRGDRTRTEKPRRLKRIVFSDQLHDQRDNIYLVSAHVMKERTFG